MSRNFTLGRAVSRWGTFAYITGVTPQIIENTASGQDGLAALLKSFNRKLEREFF